MANYDSGYKVAGIIKIAGWIIGAVGAMGMLVSPTLVNDGYWVVFLVSLASLGQGLLLLAAGHFLKAHFDSAINSYEMVKLLGGGSTSSGRRPLSQRTDSPITVDTPVSQDYVHEGYIIPWKSGAYQINRVRFGSLQHAIEFLNNRMRDGDALDIHKAS
ncbi:hypothetical protein Q8W25_08675 [Shimia thalassica]|uniref:hypothetical protein n=1 Tax=Shimia thalassica TaxID=1715693 RepID=UPI002736446D|nr:hypothetical protein [Shimia thalassica]MDP2494087.1 hypothetical protein [Shimia thalassica]